MKSFNIFMLNAVIFFITAFAVFWGTTQSAYAQAQITKEEKPTLNADTLLNIVNKYRTSNSLSALEKDERLCIVAKARLPQLENEILVSGKLHEGFYQMNLSFWATENLIYARSEIEALSWWLNSYIHKKTIEGNYKYTCAACSDQMCSQIFTNYEPKQPTLNY